MKNLGKYLSTLGLMFVAFLCLGVGLKAGEKAAAKIVLYVGSNATYTMSGGEINGDYDSMGVDIAKGGTFIMNGGTISCGNYGISVAGTFTMNQGTISGTVINEVIGVSSNGVFNMAGGTISDNEIGVQVYNATINMTGGTITRNDQLLISGSSTFNYTAGTINDTIALEDGNYITLKKAPTSALKIKPDSIAVGTKIVKLDGLTSLTTTQLSYLNVTNMLTDTQLEIQETDGSYWVVVTGKTYTVDFKTNMNLIDGGWNIYGDYVTPYEKNNDVALHFTKGAKITLSGTSFSFTNCVERYSHATVSLAAGYTVESIKASDGTVIGPNGYEIKGDTSITIYYKATNNMVKISVGTGNSYTIFACMTTAPLYRNLSFTANEEESDSRSYDVAYDDFPILINSMLGRATLQFVAGCLCV